MLGLKEIFNNIRRRLSTPVSIVALQQMVNHIELPKGQTKLSPLEACSKRFEVIAWMVRNTPCDRNVNDQYESLSKDLLSIAEQLLNLPTGTHCLWLLPLHAGRLKAAENLLKKAPEAYGPRTYPQNVIPFVPKGKLSTAFTRSPNQEDRNNAETLREFIEKFQPLLDRIPAPLPRQVVASPPFHGRGYAPGTRR